MRRHRSLATVLNLIFLPLLLAAVGSTSWFAHRAGQRSVDEVATALGRAYEERIRESVVAFLAEPERMARATLSDIELGMLDPTDRVALRRHFAKQVIDFDSVAYLYIGTPDGESTGFQREVDGTFSFSETDAEGRLATYAMREDLGRGAMTDPGSSYDVLSRPWYRAAVAAGRPTWSDIYVWFGRDELCVDVVAPLHRDGELVGVVDAGYTLGHLSAFLEGLRIGKTGEAFVVDGKGLVVATSTGQSLLVNDGDEARRARADELDARLSSFVGIRLSELEEDGPFTRLDHPELGPLTVMVRPLLVHEALGWTLAVAIPQSDFTEHYEALQRQTAVLTLLAVLFALMGGFVFVRRIAGPLGTLVKAANRIRFGELDVKLPPVTGDEVGALTIAMTDMVTGLRERATIREAFGRYVTEEVAESVLRDPDAMRLGGVRRRVTILMSDLRGFTARANHLEPEALISLLNEYLGEMTTSIVAHEGLIVEFIGDAILVLFGATGARDDDATRAARCALDMHDRLDALNHKLVQRGVRMLQMGVGLHTGEVIVGNIGSEHRVKFGVVGDAVNTTARVEALTVGGQVLVSASTGASLDDSLTLGPSAKTRVKGLTEPLVIHELLRPRADGAGLVPEDMEPGCTLALYQMTNKTLSEEVVTVVVREVGSDRLHIDTPVALTAFEDVLLLRPPSETSSALRLYCKVTDGSRTDPGERHERTLIVTATAEVGG